ncbi:unnamed protein product [Eruca vesicaria subsp. sativa]|uniref:Syntaxin 6/10/61 N-terminal domain-containing protein n=1 Tax=Eruca vesicaria subsp. sativa TaxID=29727 RepID=A0ABC8K2X8_ERUVS|nr:unnamed protein product [Eruca vesicaria subsp. sativa]
MTTSLDRWEKDPFFAAAEEVQESADRMESAYRTWIKRGSSNVWDSDQLHRDLHAALGTTKWQLDEFQRAVQSSYNNRLSNETRDRHREFTSVMETQVAKIEKSLKEADGGKGTPRWVRLDEDDRNELALFLSGSSASEKKQLQETKQHGHRRTASATPDIGAWNIPVSDDEGLLKKSSREPPVRPPRKVPSVSGFLNFMEPGRRWILKETLMLCCYCLSTRTKKLCVLRGTKVVWSVRRTVTRSSFSFTVGMELYRGNFNGLSIE